MKLRQLLIVCLISITMSALPGSAPGQESGPLLPHVGGKVNTAFANQFGPDAVSTLTFTAVTPELLSMQYTSTRGLAEKLSAERAAAVKAAIVKKGIAADRLQTAGLEAFQPKGDNGTLQGRALNRRVELLRTDR